VGEEGLEPPTPCV